MSLAAIEENPHWDKVGYWASSACAVHCLLSPLLFLALPAFGQVWAHPSTHALMALIVVPLACRVLLKGYRSHRKRWILGSTLLGIVCILIGSALPYWGGADALATGGATDCAGCCPTVVTDASGDTQVRFPPATIVTIFGSLFLIAAHWGNLHSCRARLGSAD